MSREKKDITAESILDKAIKFFLENRLFVIIILLALITWGVVVAPFDWDISLVPRYPVPVDAIPDISENQQIVFTRWEGRSPQDVEDQITYPVSVALLGIPGVKTIRSNSMFGFSTIYVIFDESVDFYWSRSRILEKLASFPSSTLPRGVEPVLGPDATALGQIFWYTLEGRDETGKPAEGWNLDELRSLQDWYIRYALASASGVSEVASVGGFVKEYQVDLNPDALRAADISISQVIDAIRNSNRDAGARSLEVNRVEYFIRGIGFAKNLTDLRDTVITTRDNVALYVKDVANVTEGPALRRGVLDKGGSEAVGGVVVARFGENPLDVIKNVKQKISEIAPGLPERELADGRISKVTIVPFYDRTGLIYETLGTLNKALTEEILVTIVVILLLVAHLRSSFLIAGLLPVAVLMSFIFMKIFGVDANIVALSGIAIAIGTMVDMGIVISENILRRGEEAAGRSWFSHIYDSTREVSGAVMTAVLTTIVSFLPVFTLTASEGKLFKPLAFTKTFALFSALIVSIVIIPPMALLLFKKRELSKNLMKVSYFILAIMGIFVLFSYSFVIGFLLLTLGIYGLFKERIPSNFPWKKEYIPVALVLIAVLIILASSWTPVGIENGVLLNFVFVALVIGLLILIFKFYLKRYERILARALENKRTVLAGSLLLVFFGLTVWLGFGRVFSWMPGFVERSRPFTALSHAFPGLGREFMPPLDEGSFLLMPTTMPHASIGEAYDVLRKQDIIIESIPEVEESVGKIGRVESALDPAPVSMIETVINYKSEFLKDENGNIILFDYEPDETDFFRDVAGTPLNAPDGKPYHVHGAFIRDENGNLIPDSAGRPFRLWRPALLVELNPGRQPWDGISSPDDIWDIIVKETRIPGTTSAPKLQPINGRVVMLQSGMRSPMGIKVKGPDLETIEMVGLQLEELLKKYPKVKADTVIAERIIGKPYLEIHILRRKAAKHGLRVEDIQKVIEYGIGGRKITTIIDGRERYPVRVRYKRELRGSIEAIGALPVRTEAGYTVPIREVAEIKYRRGPQSIKSEDTFLTSYVLFDKMPGESEVEVVESLREYLRGMEDSSQLNIPPGVSYSFAGTYENQVRSMNRLRLILPLSLVIIFLILYFKFRSALDSMIVFVGIIIAWAGGFILLWLYNQPWFLDFGLFGLNLRELLGVHPVNLSVAVWVGFLALFGIASDDGVVMMTYLTDQFKNGKKRSIKQVRSDVINGASKRIRPALMTSATTILALLPVLTSTGRGSDIMIAMAIPTFGGMFAALLATIVTPVFFSWVREKR